ncbi:hypothetical protein Tco_1293698 [Tanacetum coccineum]
MLKIQYGGINKTTKCWNGSCMNSASTILEDATCVHVHASRKEISPYTIYNYKYAEQEAYSLLNAASITTASSISESNADQSN